MPVVTVRQGEFTPATFNTEKLTAKTAAVLGRRFGAERVKATPVVMGGEDFSRFWLADKSIESLIFWVGGVPEAKWQAANGDAAKLPSLHSPFWAPDAETTIATATEAMTAAALGVLRKG
jgi:hippurate hydrolase